MRGGVRGSGDCRYWPKLTEPYAIERGGERGREWGAGLVNTSPN